MFATVLIIQSMIIDVCNRFGLITCIPGALSPSGVANLIKVT